MAADAEGDVQIQEIDSDVEFVCQPTFTVDVTDELRSEGHDADGDDPERLQKETEPWPSLFPPANPSLQFRQDTEKAVAQAMESADFARAITVYTEAMRGGGSNPAMLSTRAALLLKCKRPCAAVRDCTAAIQINASMVKAYRIRGMSHRRLGHWKKAHRDLTEAQNLKYDAEMAEMLKIVANRGKKVLEPEPTKNSSPDARASRRKRRSSPDRKADATSMPTFDFPDFPEPMSSAPQVSLPDLTKGQAVVIVGLEKAGHLNGRRGVVEREDPRPASKGRWEVEVRMDGGLLEVKSLKRENIQTLNKVDREACKAWAKAEKAHKDARERKEQHEEMQKYKNVVEAKIGKLALQDRARDLLRTLGPEQALSVLDRCEGPGVTNINEFVVTQAKLLLGQDSDSEDDAPPPSKKAR
eukprot:TRINITY_DN92441_c0_g1_i1.p1 TRINITY_DN92441_c0_g1~~TRINITY_DN92441_c0_g1_i1.p1  ORF type:complete len:413 (+),score=91.22 TRINITY_DN92441_c0_g1_i1:40-1278(+)